MKKLFSLPRLAAGAAVLCSLASCEKSLDDVAQPAPGGRPGLADVKRPELSLPFYALAGGVQLDAFNAADPERVLNSAPITGLQPGESILALDFRPATGQLYGLGSTSRLYVLNPQTGAARAVNATPFAPALDGAVAGFDFNPTVDRIRVVTADDQNLRLNPETGTVAVVDGPINGPVNRTVDARIAAVAYTNNVAGAATTTLYDIDVATQKLYRQNPPNAGTLEEVGDLKLKVTGEGGFDIAPGSDRALGLFEVNKKATLFTVDLTTGEARVLAKYDKRLMYTGIAIPTNPVAYAVNPDNKLLIFDPAAAAPVAKPITGLQAGETVLGLDFRPLNGQLYALGSTSRLYTLNAASGAAALVGALSTPLAGEHFGFDFNPVVDRIRIVSNTGQNLRVVPTSGAATVDGSLNPEAPAVSAAAYENNFAGTTSTTLYVIDHRTDKLYRQNPPNAGTLVAIGNLGVDVDALNGYDIGGTSDTGYALLTVAGVTQLYTIDDKTGNARMANDYRFGSAVTGFTVGLGF